MDALQASAHNAKNVIFASGHEHLLQYTEKAGMHYVVSGSASRKSFAQKGNKASFVYGERGYGKLDFYENGEVWLSFYSVKGPGLEGELQFRNQLVEPTAGTIEDVKEYPDSEDLEPTIITAANKKFAAKGFKNFWMGAQYRDMWATDLEVPIIDLKNTKGGLTPIKKGGGMASNSLGWKIRKDITIY